METEDKNWWINQMKTFEIRVNSPLGYHSFYNDIKAPNYVDAERNAKIRFCEDFGGNNKGLECWTFNKQLPIPRELQP
jgi:hypothetical protein